MRKRKRTVIATFSGVLCGFICLALASSSPGELPQPVIWRLVGV